MSGLDDLTIRLLDYMSNRKAYIGLHETGEGTLPTIYEIAAGLEVDKRTAHKAIHRFRNFLSGDEGIALITVRGHRQTFYGITASAAHIQPYAEERERDTDTRITTILSQQYVAVKMSDGRSGVGRRARIRVKHLNRMIEDLRDIKEAVA